MINLLGANAAAAMQQSWIPRANSSNSTNNTNNTNTDNSTDPAADTQDLFLKLLVAQLKTQDPTSPMDPTQMVGQMLSMNQLNELIQIRQLIQGTPTSIIIKHEPNNRSLIPCQIFRFHFPDCKPHRRRCPLFPTIWPTSTLWDTRAARHPFVIFSIRRSAPTAPTIPSRSEKV